MARILIIDDRPLNRQFLKTLLGYQHHDLCEASDGAEGLRVAREERPDLIISDVLMPTMDGYEFVHRLREDPQISKTQVVFSTAHYLSRESQALAAKCGVASIIYKPCEPQVVLDTVAAALAGHAGAAAAEPVGPEEFEREHQQLLTNKLAEKTDQLREVNTKLTALVELSTELASERDPVQLLDRYCSVAREVIGARWALVVLLEPKQKTVQHLEFVGIDLEDSAALRSALLEVGIFKTVTSEGRTICLSDVTSTTEALRLPPSLPRAESLLVVPLSMHEQIYGWICLADKLGFDAFSEQDQQLALALATKIAVAYDNARLFRDSVSYANKLEAEMSERNRIERQLGESKARLAGIIGSAMDAIMTVDSNQRITLFNEAAEKMFRCTAAEAIGHSLERFIPPRFRPRHAADIRRFGETGVTTRVMGAARAVSGLRADGNEFPLEASISQIQVGAQRLYTVIMRDITERKQVEDELRKLSLIVENSMDFIGIASLQGAVSFINPTGQRMVGLDSAEQVRGTNLIDCVAPEDRLRVQNQVLPAVFREGHWEGETLFRNFKTGEVIPMWQHAFFITEGEDKRRLALATVCRNLTERKQLEDQLRQSQKMEAIGQLAGGVAHDFNNLLTAINGYSSLALMRIDGDTIVKSYLEEIRKAGDRAANLTRQLLAFGRKQILQPLPLNLNEVVGDMNKMLRRLIGEDIALTAKLDPALRKIKADPGQVEQVLVNLVVNARDAMPKGGHLTIETTNCEIDSEYASKHVDVRPGSYVMLAVSDTGCGMGEETRARIFEPFFTTKEKGKGTGLGLSTVYGIVKQSGGNIWVYSEPGQGTSFKVYLPQAGPGAEPDSQPTVEVAASGGSETILVVEDEDVVRGLARKILEEAGYHVLDANGGAEAVRVCQQHSEPIDLLLTDVVMPETSGKEIADHLTSLRPNTRVLFMSGYTDESIVHHGIVDSGVEFIQKPFSPSALTKKVRDVLDLKVDGNPIG